MSGAVLASVKNAGVPSTSLQQFSCLKPLQARPLRAPVVCPAWHLMGRLLCSAGAKTQIHQIAKDISGHGNDLPLITPPARKDMVIKKVCPLLALPQRSPCSNHQTCTCASVWNCKPFAFSSELALAQTQSLLAFLVQHAVFDSCRVMSASTVPAGQALVADRWLGRPK